MCVLPLLAGTRRASGGGYGSRIAPEMWVWRGQNIHSLSVHPCAPSLVKRKEGWGSRMEVGGRGRNWGRKTPRRYRPEFLRIAHESVKIRSKFTERLGNIQRKEQSDEFRGHSWRGGYEVAELARKRAGGLTRPRSIPAPLLQSARIGERMGDGACR
jgi:hypothetical protein